MRFADEVQASFPVGLVLPPAIRLALDWLEEQGCVRRYTTGGRRYASLYPASVGDAGTAIIAFETVEADHAAYWLGLKTPGADRIAPFIRTGGEGSYAALWLDPDGRQRFIHMGSGSGSTWAGVLADDPVDILRFLAMGYRESCWPEYHHQPPEDVAESEGFVPPSAFREWVTQSFGVTIPRTAREIIPVTPNMDERSADDPFLRWVDEAQASIEQR